MVTLEGIRQAIAFVLTAGTSCRSCGTPISLDEITGPAISNQHIPLRKGQMNLRVEEMYDFLNGGPEPWPHCDDCDLADTLGEYASIDGGAWEIQNNRWAEREFGGY